MHLHHEHTGVRCWRSRRLPGPPLSIHHLTAAEALVWLLVVGLASVPLLLWSQRAPWAWAAAGLALAVTACLLWAQRVAVGADWVAVRRYLRWHVVTRDHVARLSARPSQRGRVVRVDCDDGSHLVLHRGELADLEPALQRLVSGNDVRHDRGVEELLHLR